MNIKNTKAMLSVEYPERDPLYVELFLSRLFSLTVSLETYYAKERDGLLCSYEDGCISRYESLISQLCSRFGIEIFFCKDQEACALRFKTPNGLSNNPIEKGYWTIDATRELS